MDGDVVGSDSGATAEEGVRAENGGEALGRDRSVVVAVSGRDDTVGGDERATAHRGEDPQDLDDKADLLE